MRCGAELFQWVSHTVERSISNWPAWVQSQPFSTRFIACWYRCRVGLRIVFSTQLYVEQSYPHSLLFGCLDWMLYTPTSPSLHLLVTGVWTCIPIRRPPWRISSSVAIYHQDTQQAVNAERVFMWQQYEDCGKEYKGIFHLYSSRAVLWDFLWWHRLKRSNSATTIAPNANEGILVVSGPFLYRIRSDPAGLVYESFKYQSDCRQQCQYSFYEVLVVPTSYTTTSFRYLMKGKVITLNEWNRDGNIFKPNII